jgi:hypothetical protein
VNVADNDRCRRADRVALIRPACSAVRTPPAQQSEQAEGVLGDVQGGTRHCSYSSGVDGIQGPHCGTPTCHDQPDPRWSQRLTGLVRSWKGGPDRCRESLALPSVWRRVFRRTDRIAPSEILALVLALANMWQLREPEFLDLVEPDRRRAAVVEAVRRLTAP